MIYPLQSAESSGLAGFLSYPDETRGTDEHRTDHHDQLIALFVATKRSEHTGIAYRHSIELLLAFVIKPLQAVTLEDAVNYRAHLLETYRSVHRVTLHINDAKSLFVFAVGLNVLVTNVFAAIRTDTVPEVTHKCILTGEEVMQLSDAPARQRDKLIVRLLYRAGLRVSELCNLCWDDLSVDGVLHVRSGKGQKERFVTRSEATHKRLRQWQAASAGAIYIFTAPVTERGGMTLDGRLSAMQIYRIIKKAAKRAGLSPDASAIVTAAMPSTGGKNGGAEDKLPWWAKRRLRCLTTPQSRQALHDARHLVFAKGTHGHGAHVARHAVAAQEKTGRCLVIRRFEDDHSIIRAEGPPNADVAAAGALGGLGGGFGPVDGVLGVLNALFSEIEQTDIG